MSKQREDARRRRWAHAPRRCRLLLLRALIWLALRLFRRLPWAAAYRLADWLGSALFGLLADYRRTALENLQQAFGQVCPASERWRLAHRSFRNLARTVVELLKTAELSPQEWRERVQVEGEAHAIAALALGKGLIVVTAHLGNWEWLASRASLDYRLSFVVRDQDDPIMDSWLRDLRQSGGGRILSRNDVAGMLRVLQRAEILGVLADQNTHRGAVFVPFFGRLAATAPGAALLALRRDVPVLAAFIHRVRGNRHRIVCHPPLRMDRTGDQQADVWRNTARLTRVIEKSIEEHPDEWLWVHRRWKKRPPEEEAR